MSSITQDLAMNILPIESYDAAEQDGRVDLSFAEIMAFSPRTFAQYGFPDRVKVERELARYADWNRDLGNQEYFKPGQFLKGPAVQTDFTLDEVELLTRLRDQVVEMTEHRLGRAVRPLCGPFAQLGLFRILNALRDIYDLPHLSVFEVGPGTGYLGALLLNQGHSYASMDNAQALYLFQNRLFSHVAAGERAEWGNADCRGYRKLARCTTIPWWEFVRLPRHCPFNVDLVISNTNLCEMTIDAMRFVVRIAQRMLAESKLGMFLFTNIGHAAQSNYDIVHGEFERTGYTRVFQRLFYGYVLKGRLPPAAAAMLEKQIPLYNPSKRPERLAAGDTTYLPDDQRPIDLDFTKFQEGWEPPVRKSR
jgi:hypothetical protein